MTHTIRDQSSKPEDFTMKKTGKLTFSKIDSSYKTSAVPNAPDTLIITTDNKKK